MGVFVMTATPSRPVYGWGYLLTVTLLVFTVMLGTNLLTAGTIQMLTGSIVDRIRGFLPLTGNVFNYFKRKISLMGNNERLPL
jgi:hypothetical protein